ncbi:MAG: hypothetical protein DYG89_52910 [Caldilinea sp. CFX5]|nr:hypothetical protein [Caldilinea sp. CFX5]
MCVNPIIKPTSADVLNRLFQNASHWRQAAGMTAQEPSRWRHLPPAALLWELPAWLRRYLLAEVVGLLVALGSITLTSRLTDNTFLLVAVSVYSGAVGYYSTLFLSLFYALRRVKPLAGDRSLPYSRRRKIRTLLMTLGSAELVDSLLLSPLLLYLALHLLPNQQLAVVVSEVVSTLAFYGTVALVRRSTVGRILCGRKGES